MESEVQKNEVLIKYYEVGCNSVFAPAAQC